MIVVVVSFKLSQHHTVRLDSGYALIIGEVVQAWLRRVLYSSSGYKGKIG
jgi:hypothetical protein